MKTKFKFYLHISDVAILLIHVQYLLSADHCIDMLDVGVRELIRNLHLLLHV